MIDQSPLWEKASKVPLEEACNAVLRELTSDLARIVNAGLHDPGTPYERVVEALDATKAETRGSGLLTSVLAAVVAHLYRYEPEAGVLAAVNALGTDTDTIGTMAGALLGAVAIALTFRPPRELSVGLPGPSVAQSV